MSAPLAYFLVTLALVFAVGLGMRVGVAWEVRRRAPRPGDSIGKREMMELIIRTDPDGVAVVDGFEDVVLHNPRARELGLVHDRFLDRRAWEVAEEVLRRGEALPVDLTVAAPRRGGSEVTIAGKALPLGDKDGRFVVLHVSDQSEHVRMEAARRDFVANVSHELKTPVGAMALLAEALLESKDDPDSVEYFGGRVIKESRRLGNMVNELIALSKLQGAEKLPDLEVVSVDEIVTEALRRSQMLAETKGIVLTADRPSGEEVLGDATLLATALSNLVSNAINYSPRGTQVTVSRGIQDDQMCLRVTDRGIGIAPEHQARVFERFFRVDKARSRATGGTGLGLAIVKHVVNNHGGSVRLWSKLGTGSTFTMALPRHTSPDEDAPDRDEDVASDAVVTPAPTSRLEKS